EPVVAAGPDDPHVAALNLVRCEAGAIVHGLEIVLAGGGKRFRLSSGPRRLIPHPAGLVAPNQKHCNKRQGDPNLTPNSPPHRASPATKAIAQCAAIVHDG